VSSIANGTLPGPLDYEVVVPPVKRFWVRRVTNANIWIFYSFDDEAVTLLYATSSPPIPAD
jgi:hypothetical protein